jgi:hypothetical protein
MFKLLDERYTRVSYIMSLYQENRLPLSMIARLIRRPRRIVWEGLIASPEGKIFAASDDTQVIHERNAAIQNANKITLDLSALLTLEHLELTDRLPRQFPEILVAQAVLDEINQDLIDESFGGKQKGNLSRDGIRYVIQESTDGEQKQQIAFLERLRDFVLSKTKVVPSKRALELGKERFEKLNEMLGEGGVASILVAEEHNSLLYSDDLGLSTLARNEHGIESIWTQTVLLSMSAKNIISGNEYHDAVRKLLIANYFSTFISIDDMKWVLSHNNFSLTSDVTHIIGFLRGSEDNEDLAVDLISELIKFVWVQTSIDSQRWLFLDFALNTLMAGRESGRVSAKLTRKLQSKFLFLPLDLPLIMQNIRVWQRRSSRARSFGH